jgi:hypothetical protein
MEWQWNCIWGEYFLGNCKCRWNLYRNGDRSWQWMHEYCDGYGGNKHRCAKRERFGEQYNNMRNKYRYIKWKFRNRWRNVQLERTIFVFLYSADSYR